MNDLSRRELFERTAGTLSALTISQPGVNEHRQLTPSSSRVELAIATIALDGFGDEYFKYTFESLPQLGIRNVEYNVWYPRTITPAGIEHIMIGPDHIAFLIGLLLLGGGWRRLLTIVTAFTIGHSVTLSLAARRLGWFRVRRSPPSRRRRGLERPFAGESA